MIYQEYEIDEDTKKGEWLLIDEHNVAGIAARDLKKGEIVKYISGENTEDVLARCGDLSSVVAGEDIRAGQAVYLDAEGKAKSADINPFEIPAGFSFSMVEDEDGPT